MAWKMHLRNTSRHFPSTSEKWVTNPFRFPLHPTKLTLFVHRHIRTVPLQLYVPFYFTLNKHNMLTIRYSRKCFEWKGRKVCTLPCTLIQWNWFQSPRPGHKSTSNSLTCLPPRASLMNRTKVERNAEGIGNMGGDWNWGRESERMLWQCPVQSDNGV